MTARFVFVVALGAFACTTVETPSSPPTPATPPPTLTSSPPKPAAPLTWDIVVSEDFVLHETVCPATALAPEVAAAKSYVVGGVSIVDGCNVFDFDLKAAAVGLDDRALAIMAADDVVMASPDVFLWHPRPARHGTLRVQLPDVAGFTASLPFPVGEDGRAIVDASTWAFLSTAVFGKVSSRTIAAAGAEFDVVTLPGDLTMVRADVDRWLMTAASAVSSGSSGRFPVPRVLVVVDPVLAGGVPFGMVQRGGGPQALLLLGQRASIRDVVDDWVAVHELSHLLIPPVALDDTWLSEGLASYQQNILRARAGLMTDVDAWEALRDGFERGADATERGPFTISLHDASAGMRQSGRYLQVYWGGAALVLLVDVGLRRCGGGSIDDIAASLRADQPAVDVRRVPAQELVRRAAARGPACAGIADDVAAGLRAPFPTVGPLLQQLGVTAHGLDDRAPLAQIRRDISARVR